MKKIEDKEEFIKSLSDEERAFYEKFNKIAKKSQEDISDFLNDFPFKIGDKVIHIKPMNEEDRVLDKEPQEVQEFNIKKGCEDIGVYEAEIGFYSYEGYPDRFKECWKLV